MKKLRARCSGPALALAAICTVFFLVSCAANNRDVAVQTPNMPLKAWIGMTLEELQSVYPDIRQVSDSKERYERRTQEFGLAGVWQYSFTNRRLHWFVFNASETRIDKPNFNTCLAATTAIIDSYREILGQPQRYRLGIPSFNDPVIKPHNGYMVEQAVWETTGARIKVDFSFLGENKAYEFLVSMQVSN